MKQLINKIKNLTTNEKLHILNILKKHNITFTKNSNGYFFDLSLLSDELVNKLIKCAELIESKRDLIERLDKKRNEQLNYYRLLIVNQLKETVQ